MVEGFLGDLSNFSDVKNLAKSVSEKYPKIDVLINNGGVLKTAMTVTAEGFGIRFVVNTFAPFLLTQLLLPTIGKFGRVINLSSAAQSPVNLDAMEGKTKITDDLSAYAQSKLAL